MVLAVAVLLIGTSSPWAQAPPGPLQDDFCDWMVGKWEGTTESSMGKSNDEMEVDWDLEHQFIEMRYKSKVAETDPAKLEAMAKAMGATKEQVLKPYKGRGLMTMNPQTQEFVTHWFDSMRGIYLGKGKREGDVITTNFESPMGTEVRTIEKAGADKMVMTFKGKDPQGNEVTGTTTFMRKVKKEKGEKKS
jgi:hypothetical protein